MAGAGFARLEAEQKWHRVDEAEHAAMVSVLRPYLAADPNRSPTVKINVAWTENDYQLDISLPEDRATYKPTLDRAESL